MNSLNPRSYLSSISSINYTMKYMIATRKKTMVATPPIELVISDFSRVALNLISVPKISILLSNRDIGVVVVG